MQRTTVGSWQINCGQESHDIALFASSMDVVE